MQLLTLGNNSKLNGYIYLLTFFIFTKHCIGCIYRTKRCMQLKTRSNRLVVDKIGIRQIKLLPPDDLC